MKIYQSNLLSNFENLTHAFTSRDGGISKAPYNSLNLAFHVGDNPLDAEKNHQLLASKLNYKLKNLVHMKQIHSSTVHSVDTQDDFNHPPTCDALITNKVDTPIMVMVADCTPVLFYDKKKQVIAVAHVGREGAFKNIIKNVINSFRDDFDSNTKDIVVAVGASIGVCCYEIGLDLYEQTKALNLSYSVEKRGSKYYLDIGKIIQKQLSECKIQKTNIDNFNICNCCNSDRYFSYRANQTTGRFCGVMMLKRLYLTPLITNTLQ